MDSKVVDHALKATLWSVLEQAGFNRRTGRTAWRDHGEAVECVNVQSFNSYLADGLGATTYSFAVNLGVFYEAIARRTSFGNTVKDYARPPEYMCQLRKHLEKGFAQPTKLDRPRIGIGRSKRTSEKWTDRPDVWQVLPDGSNVQATTTDATKRVIADGLPWFDLVSDPREAVRRFSEAPDTDVPRESYGGAIGSPNRWRAIGALAASRGDWNLVQRAVDAMSSLEHFRDQPSDLDRLREELAANAAS